MYLLEKNFDADYLEDIQGRSESQPVLIIGLSMMNLLPDIFLR